MYFRDLLLEVVELLLTTIAHDSLRRTLRRTAQAASEFGLQVPTLLAAVVFYALRYLALPPSGSRLTIALRLATRLLAPNRFPPVVGLAHPGPTVGVVLLHLYHRFFRRCLRNSVRP